VPTLVGDIDVFIKDVASLAPRGDGLDAAMIKRLTSILRSSKFHCLWVDLALRLVRMRQAEIAFDMCITIALRAEKKKQYRIFPYWTVVSSKLWRQLEGDVFQRWYETLLCEKIYRAANLRETLAAKRIRGERAARAVRVEHVRILTRAALAKQQSAMSPEAMDILTSIKAIQLSLSILPYDVSPAYYPLTELGILRFSIRSRLRRGLGHRHTTPNYIARPSSSARMTSSSEGGVRRGQSSLVGVFGKQ
jgi:hypothetical protein